MKVFGPSVLTTSLGASFLSALTGSADPDAHAIEQIVLNASRATVHAASVIYTDGSSMGGFGHTMMEFRCNRDGDARNLEFMCGYAWNMTSLEVFAQLEGLVVAASPEIFFHTDPNRAPLYDDSTYERFQLAVDESKGRRLLQAWMRLMRHTPHYTLTSTNCASVIRDMLVDVFDSWELRSRPHGWGLGNAPWPGTLRSVLRDEFDGYAEPHSAVRSYETFEARHGQYLRRSHRRRVGSPADIRPTMQGGRRRPTPFAR